MRVNIYYGGRGLIEDSTIYVINSVTEILKELRVDVQLYNLYEKKNSITTLPKTLKEADGVILATHLEWFGIGGLMQYFLDSCWLYGDKNELERLYMMPIVIASTYGERDAECTLIKAWELLGGIPVTGLCAFVEDYTAFETDSNIGRRIEKLTENFYRNMNQHQTALPSSSNEVRKKVLKTKSLRLTPQESEQLSEYVSNDTYVKKQKEDIEELAQMFKGMLGETTEEEDDYCSLIRKAFTGADGETKALYKIALTDTNEDIYIRVNEGKLECAPELPGTVDVLVKLTSGIFESIINNEKNMHQAFMAGDLTAKGNFNLLRMLDTFFDFNKE